MSMDRAKEIVRLHGQIGDALRLTVENAIRIGQLLTEQKKELGHGKFGVWLKRHVPAFSRATVTNYMRLYDDREKIKLLKISKLKDAYALIYNRPQPRRKPKPEDDPADDPPDEFEVTFKLTEDEAAAFGDLIDKLAQLKPFDPGKAKDHRWAVVLAAMEFAYKECNGG
jgi:hypothetical protein